MARIGMVIAVVVALVLSWFPASYAIAQDAQETFSAGEAADDATTEEVLSFVAEAVELFNVGDGVVAFEEGLLGLANATIRLDDVRDVRVHDEDVRSVEVTYAGWVTQRTYYTERWYLSPTDDGDAAYLITAIEAEAPRLPDDETTATIDVVLADDALSVSADTVPAAEFLRYLVENRSDQTSLTTGLYVLPDGVTAAEAQAGLIEDAREGVFDSLQYVGPTPVRQSDTFEFAFDVKPGLTLLIQQFTLDDDFQNVVPLEGEEYATTLTIEAADASS